MDAPEHPGFDYHYATNLYRPDDVIQDKFLGFDPDSARACADLCNSTLGGSCKSWTFCWSSGRCATMARAPASTTQRADGRPAYAPQCASGVRRGAEPVAAPGKFVTLRFGNDCPVPVVAAVHYKDLSGEWATGGWFSLAPGETKDVARTRNTVFYVSRPVGRGW